MRNAQNNLQINFGIAYNGNFNLEIKGKNGQRLQSLCQLSSVYLEKVSQSVNLHLKPWHLAVPLVWVTARQEQAFWTPWYTWFIPIPMYILILIFICGCKLLIHLHIYYKICKAVRSFSENGYLN